MKRNWRQPPQRRVARDYARRRYGNPLFRTRGKKESSLSSQAVGRVLLISLLAAVVIGGFWYAGWGKAFQISSLELIGASPAFDQTVRKLIDERMKMRKVGFIPQSSIFFFDRDAALDAIRDQFSLEKIELRKKLPNSLVLEVREKEIRAALLTSEGFMAVDGSGTVIRRLTESEVGELGDFPPDVASVAVPELGAEMVEVKTKEGDAKVNVDIAKNRNRYPLIVDRKAAKKRPGETIVSPGTMALILQANARMPDVAGERVRWFEADDGSETLTIIMGGDWRVLFATATPFDPQAERLSLVLKENIGAKRPQLEYIDLRYNEKIFYRLKDAAE